MDHHELTATAAAGILTIVAVFQGCLAAGAPAGAAAWGGRYRVLPPKLRVGSLAAAVVLCFAGWLILARAALVAPGPATGIRVATWAFAGVFALNTLGNLGSQSRMERMLMTPITVFLTASFGLLAMR